MGFLLIVWFAVQGQAGPATGYEASVGCPALLNWLDGTPVFSQPDARRDGPGDTTDCDDDVDDDDSDEQRVNFSSGQAMNAGVSEPQGLGAEPFPFRETLYCPGWFLPQTLLYSLLHLRN
jgi:hypothetical protein